MPSLFNRTYQNVIKISAINRIENVTFTNLDMSQSLPVKYETFTLFHGIINIEVLHAQNFLVDIQLSKIPSSASRPPNHCTTKRSAPNHSSQRFHGTLAAYHVPDTLWHRLTQYLVILIHAVMFVSGIQFFQFLKGLIKSKAFALAQAGPET